MAQGVEFEEDSFSYKKPSVPGAPAFGATHNLARSGPVSRQPRMSQFLMRHGLAKSPQVAQSILIGVVIINIIITYFVITHFL